MDAVENSAGLTLFPEALKAVSKPLCQASRRVHCTREPAMSRVADPLSRITQTVKCQVVVRRFDDANKRLGGGGKGGRGRSGSVSSA